MSYFPLIQILFWIAVNLAPEGTSQISITAPKDKTWTWTKQESGWGYSVDQSVYAFEGSTVTTKSAEKVNKEDVGEFVKGIKEQDWAKSPSLKLDEMTSLTKKGDTFIYTQNGGQIRYVIEFKKK